MKSIERQKKNFHSFFPADFFYEILFLPIYSYYSLILIYLHNLFIYLHNLFIYLYNLFIYLFT